MMIRRNAIGRKFFLTSGEHVRPMTPRLVTVVKEVSDLKFGSGYIVKIEPSFEPAILSATQLVDYVELVPRHRDNLAWSTRWPICVHLNLLYHSSALEAGVLGDEQRAHHMWGELYPTEKMALDWLVGVHGPHWKHKNPM